MKNRLWLLLTLSAAAAAADSAEAPKAPAAASASEAVFAKLDKDQDQRISLVEARSSAKLAAAFARLDANHDGYLTPAEFAVWEEAGDLSVVAPPDPATVPGGSSGAQHMPKTDSP